MPPMVETHLANTVLTNGARYYVDHAHPEYSTPECLDPLECLVLRQGRRGGAAPGHGGGRAHPGPAGADRRLQEQLRRQGQLLRLPRELPDGPGRALRQGDRGRGAPHFVSRRSSPGRARWAPRRRPSTRTRRRTSRSPSGPSSSRRVGLETTLKRPIVNTRDEPHADPKRFRRLHVIVGDANLAEVATFLKVGTTAIVLAMIEDDAGPTRDLSLADPVRPCTRSRPTSPCPAR
jgi:hypothetical protein